MEDFQLIFNLKQHTPLFHFQHEQAGATLRASEVKPKLDQYLFERLTNLKGFHARVVFHKKLYSDKTEWKNLLIGSGEELKPSYSNEKERITALTHMALDYKLNFTPFHLQKIGLRIDKVNDKFTTKMFPLLLANMGGKPEKSELKNLTLHDTVNVSVFSFQPYLLELIKEHIGAFFMFHNFGNRQSKGFGSFTVVDKNGKNKLYKLPYKFHLETSGQNDLNMFQLLFERIDYFYRTLRSGINLPHKDFYFKSISAVYAKQKLNEQWDKKTIKEKYFVEPLSTDNSITVKDHFGLSTEEKWGVKGENWVASTGMITKSSETIDRYKSPLFFKPVKVRPNKFRIYFKHDTVPNAFRNASFKVKKDNSGDLSLSPSKTFEWDKFFAFAFYELDLDDHVNRFNKKDTDYLNHEIYTNILHPIFTELKGN